MGLKTVFALAEQQLRGQVEYASRPGFRCQVRFRDSLYQARV